MSPKKSPQVPVETTPVETTPVETTPVDATDKAIEEIQDLDALTDELHAATSADSPDDKGKGNGAVDFSALADDVTAALEGIAAEEAKVQIARLNQIPHVQKLVDRMTTVHTIWTKKTTTQTTKAEIKRLFPVIETAKGLNDAIYTILKGKPANLKESTAKNLLILAKKPQVVTHVTAKDFSVTVGYDLARAELDDSDLRNAADSGLVVSNVDSWLTTRNNAKTIKAQWPVYATAKANAERLTDQAKAQPDGAAGRDQAATLADKAKIARAEGNTSWSTITEARSAIMVSPFPTALRDLDEDIFTVVEAETAALAKAETDKAGKANDDATAKANTAKANAEAKAKLATEAETRRLLANDTARLLSDDIDAKKKAIETAEANAVDALRAELDTLTRQSTKANAELDKAKADAELAKSEAETATAKAELALRAANATANKAGQKPAQTPAQKPAVTRPQVSTHEAMIDAYNAMPISELRVQMADIATALWKRGQRFMADWVAHGAALDAELLEPASKAK